VSSGGKIRSKENISSAVAVQESRKKKVMRRRKKSWVS